MNVFPIRLALLFYLCLFAPAWGQEKISLPGSVVPVSPTKAAEPPAAPSSIPSAPPSTSRNPSELPYNLYQNPLATPPPLTLAFPATLPGFPTPQSLGNRLYLNGALDLRTRTANTGRRGGIWANETELDFQRPFAVSGKTVGNVVVQVIGEDPPDPDPRAGSLRDVEVGEAYVVYKLPIQTDTDSVSYVKVGQFQVPFALLGTYDPHLLLAQPPYAQSLGIRTDFGAEVFGTLYGALDYALSVTNGTGAGHADVDPNRLAIFRLGRTFDTRNGIVNVGGSLLSGRLPVTDLDAFEPFASELPPSGRVRATRLNVDGERFAPKSRIAGDGTYTYGPITARGEVMIGADKNNRILGYYTEGNYTFGGQRLSALLARSVFVYPVGNSNTSREFGGLTYHAGRNLSVSGLYEYLRDVPRDSPGRVRHRVTLQVLLRF